MTKFEWIVTPGQQATLAAKNATATIPIVMVGVQDPVGTGIVRSLARPGANITNVAVYRQRAAFYEFDETASIRLASGRCRSLPGEVSRSFGYPRSLNRWIFPVAVLGSSAMNSIQRGYL